MSDPPLDVEAAVVSMYSEHPFPGRKDKIDYASLRMDLRLLCCGIYEADYVGRRVLDAGCGTGEFACWFSARGADVTGIDLSEAALSEARAYAEHAGLGRVSFAKRSVLQTGFADASFDLVYSTGVLHHTADPFSGLAELCRVLRPGGKILISIYNRLGAFRSELRRRIVRTLGGNDLDNRVQWGRRLFPSQAHCDAEESYHDPETLLYDSFAIPHQSAHTLGEQLKWFEQLDLEFLGGYPPLTLSDNLRMLGLDEYWSVAPELQSGLGRALRRLGRAGGLRRQHPGFLSRLSVQMLWAVRGIEVVALGGRKPDRPRVA